jgi:hypothetical protein
MCGLATGTILNRFSSNNWYHYKFIGLAIGTSLSVGPATGTNSEIKQINTRKLIQELAGIIY